ncbi:Hpt domain-containing protein [Limnobacter alexandrii]|jgi:HPt (histidine-containing phosphotransfer) domain-containing protein|uniref:Hpt domain-containing protein n=1 Tax=Limnobacter alexandrii TaxID=2570352 RepID=UPI0011082AEB|nr:Hpt domain-containing protein [Limnobacter alexandrii]
MNLSSLSPEIDLETTLDRLCGDSALLIEILDLFLDEFSAEQPHLLKRIREEDFAELASKAHYFKGIAQNLGLIRFLPEVMLLEQAAKQSDAACCTQAVNSLNQITQHLLSLRKSMPGH